MTRKNGEEQAKFEDMMLRLEALVELLEKGKAPLDEALAVFEEAMSLSQKLKATLEKGRARVMELTSQGDIIPSAQEDLLQ